MTDEVEYRCPRNRRNMFGKLIRTKDLRAAKEMPVIEFLEFSCADCRRTLARRGLQVVRVLHRFEVATGQHVETLHQ